MKGAGVLFEHEGLRCWIVADQEDADLLATTVDDGDVILLRDEARALTQPGDPDVLIEALKVKRLLPGRFVGAR